MYCIYNTAGIEPMNPSNYYSRKQCIVGVQSHNNRLMILKNLWMTAKLAKLCKELY